MENTANLYTKERALALKGVAIIFMMFHHSFRDTDFFREFHVNFMPFAVEDIVLFSQVSKLCVAIFCFISGYGLYLAVQKFKKDGSGLSMWIYNRLVNLLTSYWYVFIACFFAILIFDKGKIADKFFYDGKIYGVLGITLDMLGLGSLFDTPLLNGAWWYMSAAVVFIIIAPVMMSFLERFGSVVVSGILIFLPRIFVESIGSENSIYKYLLIYLLGMIFAKNNLMNRMLEYLPFQKSRLLSKGSKLLAECLIFVILYKMGNVLDAKRYWEIRYTFIPLIVILISVEFITEIPYLKKTLGFLGIYSMDIFLLHNFCRNYFPQLMYQDKYFLFAPLAMLGFGIIAAIIMHYLKKLLGCDKLKNLLIWRDRTDIQGSCYEE